MSQSVPRKWLSGRKRQTVNLLDILALVRIQPFSSMKLLLNKDRVFAQPRNLLAAGVTRASATTKLLVPLKSEDT